MQAEVKKELTSQISDEKIVQEQLQILKELQDSFAPYEGCLIFNGDEGLHALNKFLPVCDRVIANLKELGELKTAQKDMLMAAYQLKSQIHCNKAYLAKEKESENEEHEAAQESVLEQIKLIETAPATKELQKLRINLCYCFYHGGREEDVVAEAEKITDEVESEESGKSKRAFEVYGKEVCLEAFIVKALAWIAEAVGVSFKNEVCDVYFKADTALCVRYLEAIGESSSARSGELSDILAHLVEIQESKALIKASDRLIKQLTEYGEADLEELEDRFWKNLEKACEHYEDADKAPLFHSYLLLANDCQENKKGKAREFYQKALSLGCPAPSYSARIFKEVDMSLKAEISQQITALSSEVMRTGSIRGGLPERVIQLESEVVQLKARLARLEKESKREVEMADSSSKSGSRKRGRDEEGEAEQSSATVFFDPKRNKDASTVVKSATNSGGEIPPDFWGAFKTDFDVS